MKKFEPNSSNLPQAMGHPPDWPRHRLMVLTTIMNHNRVPRRQRTTVKMP